MTSILCSHCQALLFHFLPLLNAVRAASRFSIMLMLALAILASYGIRHIITYFEREIMGGAGMHGTYCFNYYLRVLNNPSAACRCQDSEDL